MTRAAEVLLRSLIDYAGTFPPAKLSLAEAIKVYADHRSQVHAWMLGRFVLPSTALEEFDTVAPPFLRKAHGLWPVTIVGDRETMPDARRLADFNREWKGRAAIVAVEFGPMTPSEIAATARGLPRDLDMYFEIPPGSDIEATLAEIATSSGRAKIRTGGLTPNAFPDAMALIGFLEACHHARVPFKATAGLHHAVTGSYALTGAADSARVSMYGFLNVALAALFVQVGDNPIDTLDVLRESSPEAFSFSNEGLLWRERIISLVSLANVRRRFFKGFGSCVFSEPIAELVRLGIVEGEVRSAPLTTPGPRD
jgi:hypothetical protein